jgi:uncharacterized protein
MKGRYGDWALVTGASSGIGKALTKQLAAQGYSIVAVARGAGPLDQLAGELRVAHGVEVRVLAADLSSHAGIEAVIDGVEDLDIAVLVPCAAIETSGYFVDTPADTHARLLEMDCYGPMRLTHHFGAAMAERGRGAILLVSSLSGWMAQPYMAHYGAAKAYILGLGEGLHHEMKDKGVHVSVLSPGPTDTPMAASTGIDFASMGMAVMRPDDVAAAGLAALGRSAHAVPGFRNKLMVMMMTRLLPRGLVGQMFRWMMGKALGIKRDRAALAG